MPPKKDIKKEEDSDLDEKPASTGRASRAKASSDKKTEQKVKKESSPPPKKRARTSKAEQQEEEEEEYQWWKEGGADHAVGKGTKKWSTLEHSGVLFPPEYVPHGIPILYEVEKGKVITIPMDPDEEEVCTMFAIMREQTRPPSDYYINPVFRRNFFRDWLTILNRDKARNRSRFGTDTHPIKILERCNFDAIWQWAVEQREKKKAMTKEEKLRLSKEREEVEKPFKYCLWDGKKQPVGNFRVEPPGLFRGRGKHPKMGTLKLRVRPEDVTINIGKGAKVPTPPEGHRWKEVKSDNTATWLAGWIDNVNGNHKYVMLAAASMVKGRSDLGKFDKARKLGEVAESIRRGYKEDWGSSDRAIRQRAVALYFIDFLALRCGHEKGEEEAETFGACSLQVGHLKFLSSETHTLEFDFLGKDSIRYCNQVQVHPRVYQLCQEFTKNKTSQSPLFDSLQPSKLNAYLKELMPGLTAKVFRTYNASKCMDTILYEDPSIKELSLHEKLAYFTQANTKVAVLCNHQRSVSKQFVKQKKTLEDKLEHLEALLNRLEEAKKKAKKDRDAAAEWFNEQEEKIQLEWLDKWGTEEEKMEGIVAKKKSTSSSSKGKSSGGKKKKKKDDDDESPLSSDDERPKRKRSPAKKRKPAANDKKKKKDSDSSAASDDEDEKPSKRARKRSTKKEAEKKRKPPPKNKGRKKKDESSEESESEPSPEPSESSSEEEVPKGRSRAKPKAKR
eukprot:TRINITY_DN82059_c0_g1_i1.p1 TRINITY_DN82059_c0_g1~~TRINITY_DN82059_c0_g1_i1.p1  ORF type:complete len:730 (+),score=197.57 TRINITY_DN82059_c0_g1_i1:70-2259(+)